MNLVKFEPPTPNSPASYSFHSDTLCPPPPRQSCSPVLLHHFGQRHCLLLASPTRRNTKTSSGQLPPLTIPLIGPKDIGARALNPKLKP